MIKTDNKIIDAMFNVGAHFGYSKSRRHPSAKPFIFGAKNKVDIIDLEKTAESLAVAKEFIESLAQSGKKILLVGSKPEAKRWISDAAKSIDMPYVDERWIGGTFTNFSEIKKRAARLEDLMAKKEKGELAMYTKKERLLLDREIAKLTKNFGGITAMSKLPDAIFIIDPKHEINAMTEAQTLNIPIVALASSDCNIYDITYPIPANDASTDSVKLFIDEIVATFKNTEVKAPTPTSIEASEEKPKEEVKSKTTIMAK